MSDYWRMCAEAALEEAGLTATDAQVGLMAEVIAGGHETYGQYSGHIPNPLRTENEHLTRKLNWERERVGCGECGGRGRLEYNTGPWAVNTGCHVCHGEGKVHPRGEREPA